jgi:hypothetical protein
MIIFKGNSMYMNFNYSEVDIYLNYMYKFSSYHKENNTCASYKGPSFNAIPNNIIYYAYRKEGINKLCG